jgi:ankyrin repeat protein
LDFDGFVGLYIFTALALLPSARRRSRLRVDQALCDAASIGSTRDLQRLLADGVSPDSSDEDGTTALMLAAFSGQAKAVKLLLEAGADPDAQDVSGMTALMNAVIANCELDVGGTHPIFEDIVRQLIAAGADLEIEDQDGATAADHAATGELDELAELLAAL